MDTIPEDNLYEFVTNHESSFTFLSPTFTLERKQAFVHSLVELIENPDTDHERLNLALNALQLLARELLGSEEIFARSTFESLIRHAGFDACSSPAEVSALKCLSNVLYQSEDLRSIFLSSQKMQVLLEMIRDHAQSRELMTSRVQIAFVLSANSPEAASMITQAGLLNVLADVRFF